MYKRLFSILFVALIIGTLGLTGCDATENESEQAVAEVSPTSAPESEVQGTLTFEEEGSGVRITGTLTGLTSGAHGFHIHRDPSCAEADLPTDPDTDPDPAGAAGPHWDPVDTDNHAGLDSSFTSRHAGDLGNITATQDGTAEVDIMAPELSVDNEYSVTDHAIMVHSNRDDLTTDPSGTSGTRIGCGVIDLD